MKDLLASIDVGAHSARLLIVEHKPGSGEYEAIEDLEIPAPLGADVFRTGSIGDKSVSVLCGILKKFRAKMDEYRITRCCACATSAVREASNAEVFLERVRFRTGLKLGILTGADEARLGYISVVSRLNPDLGFAEKRVLLADIGTGACQVSSYDRGLMRFTETVKLGTLRTPENLSGETAPELRAAAIRRLTDSAFGELASLSAKLDSDCLVVTGGSVRAMLAIAGIRPAGLKDVRELRPDEFETISHLVRTSSIETLCEKASLRPDIVEAVLPCCMMIESLRAITGAATILVPMISTKYALMEDFIAREAGLPDPFEPQLFAMAALTARRYGCDPDTIETTSFFAEELFNRLQPLHGMGHRELVLLKVAARLCRTGLFINNEGYHKSSCFILMNTEIPGLTLEERKLAAMIVRYHRKALPSSQHPDYAALTPEERAEVAKLAALLRLACGLARLYAPGDKMHLKIEPEQVVVSMDAPSKTAAVGGIDTSLFNFAFAEKIIFA